jgi:hypothetical protein
MEPEDEIAVLMKGVLLEVRAARQQMETMVARGLEHGLDLERTASYEEWTRLTVARHEELQAALEQAGFLAADEEAAGEETGLSALIAELLGVVDIGFQLLRHLELVLAARRRALEAGA